MRVRFFNQLLLHFAQEGKGGDCTERGAPQGRQQSLGVGGEEGGGIEEGEGEGWR